MSHSVGALGGGISGLSALHFIRNSKSTARNSSRLIERSKQVGGWMRTSRRPVGGSELVHTYENGPRSIRGGAGGEVALALVTQLCLSHKLLTPSSHSSVRFLYMNGHISKMPTSLLEVFTSPIRRYIPAILKDAILTRSPPSNGDESVASFFERHVGVSATREMVGGIVVGIYGGSMDRLSMKSCFPAFFDAATRHGSLVRGLALAPSSNSQVDSISDALHLNSHERSQYAQNIKKVKENGGMFSFEGGIDSLAAKIREDHASYVHTGYSTEAISKEAQTGQLKIHSTKVAPEDTTSNISALMTSKDQTFDRLIAAIPSYELAKLLEPLSPKTSSLLAEIEFIDIAVVSLAFLEQPRGRKIIPDEYRGFGYLVPPRENRSILGVSFDSITFPHQSPHSDGLVRMAVMIGGDTTNNAYAVDVTKVSTEDLLAIALRSVSEDLGINVEPVSSDVFVAKKAIPQYRVGHQDKIRAIEAQLAIDLPNLKLAGASYYGVSVNDCIASGMRAALASIESL